MSGLHFLCYIKPAACCNLLNIKVVPCYPQEANQNEVTSMIQAAFTDESYYSPHHAEILVNPKVPANIFGY
jgi:hypothetical protein